MPTRTEDSGYDVTTTANLLIPRGARGHPVLPGFVGRSTFAVGRPTPVVARGAGARIWDADDNELIDLNANFTTLVHGHAHPQIVAAADRASRNGASFGLPNRSEMRHAETLLGRMPDFDQVRYVNSGTEAVMAALRLARAATGREKVAFVQRCYHGTSDSALIPGGEHAWRGVPAAVRADTFVLEMNDLEMLDRCVAEHGSQLATIVVDRLANRAGLLPLEPEYVARVRELCDRHGIVMLVDEVVTARLAVGGIAAEDGVVPDLVTLGKSIGGGYPIGAVVGKEAVMTELDPTSPRGLEHGGTFSGNPVSMEAGRVALELLDHDAVTALNERSDRARVELAQRVADAGWDVRGRGSLFRLYPQAGRARPNWQQEIWWEAYRRGVLLMQTALAAVPTVLDESELSTVVDRLTDAALAATAATEDAG
jgi:glutamate-1-semialdehyde 2,1-aminomutase